MVPPAGVTSVPTWQAAARPRSGPSFFRSLFDFSFHSFITRRLAPAIYGIGLVVIGIGALIALFSGLAGAFAAMSSSFTTSMGVLMLIGSLIGVPLVTLVFVIVLRLSVEAGIALVAVAENTERTASNTAGPETH